MESTVLKDGRTVNVIDTPGIVDWSDGSDEGGKEIAKCLDLAKDGIHAVILVFSVKSRFSEGEETMLERLQMLFGKRIVEYMILVFTGGDELEEDGETFQEYLSRVPATGQIIIEMCENRVVLFNNEAKNENVKDDQVQKLLFYVDQVMANTGGKSFSDEIFRELKQGAIKLHDNKKDIDNLNALLAEQIIAVLKKEMHKSYEDQLACITEMVEQKLNSTIERLEKELTNEQAARLKAQKIAEKARLESFKLKESLDKALKEAKESKAAQLKAQKIAEEARLESIKFKECSENARKEAEESKAAQLKAQNIAAEARLESRLESCKLKRSLEMAQKDAKKSKSAWLKAKKFAEEARLESWKLKESLEKVQKEAKESMVALLNAKRIAKEACIESRKLKESLEMAQKKAKELMDAQMKATKYIRG